MRQSIAVLALLFLTSCAEHVVSASESHVTIRYDHFRVTPEALQAKADEECAAYEREAVYEKSVKAQGIIPRYAQFACVE